MTVMPPPGWTFAAAILVAVFGLLAVAVVAKTPQGYDKSYAHFFAGLTAGIGGGQLGSLILYSSLYKPGYTYGWNNSWMGLYIFGEWVLIAMAFATTMSRQDKFPSTWPRLEFALQGFANLYLISLTCNQLAAIAPTGPGRQDALHFGEFMFAVTTIVVILTAAAYLSMWDRTTLLRHDDHSCERQQEREADQGRHDQEAQRQGVLNMGLDLQKANVAALLALGIIGVIHHVILTRRISSTKVDNGLGLKLFLSLVGLALMDANGWMFAKWLFVVFSALYSVYTFGRFVNVNAEKYTLDAVYELFTSFLLLTAVTTIIQVTEQRNTGLIQGVNVVLLVIDGLLALLTILVTLLRARHSTTMADAYKPIREVTPEKI